MGHGRPSDSVTGTSEVTSTAGVPRRRVATPALGQLLIMQCSKYIVRGRERAEVTMLMNLEVNGHTSRVASVGELRQELAPFASEQFREIWVSIDSGGLSLAALMNTNPIAERAGTA
jgi:hypothetical protein